MSTSRYPLTGQQETKLREDLSAVEDLLQGIAILMRVCHGEDSQVTIRVDENALRIATLQLGTGARAGEGEGGGKLSKCSGSPSRASVAKKESDLAGP